MNWLDYIIMLAFAVAAAVVLWVSCRNGRKLTEADKMAADWVARQVRDYGPLSQAQVRKAAAFARSHQGDRWRGRQNQMLAHGLTGIADGMRPGDRVTGSVPWWRRL